MVPQFPLLGAEKWVENRQSISQQFPYCTPWILVIQNILHVGCAFDNRRFNMIEILEKCLYFLWQRTKIGIDRIVMKRIRIRYRDKQIGSRRQDPVNNRRKGIAVYNVLHYITTEQQPNII